MRRLLALIFDVRFWLIFVVLYASTATIRQVQANRVAREEYRALQQRVTGLMSERDELAIQVQLVRDKSYQERLLRQSLTLQRAGETVYALPESNVEVEQELLLQTPITVVETRPIWQQWVEFVIN
jgi:cell division protein FtsB